MKFIKQSWKNFNRFMDKQPEWFMALVLVCMLIAGAMTITTVGLAIIYFLGIVGVVTFPFILVAITYIWAQFK